MSSLLGAKNIMAHYLALFFYGNFFKFFENFSCIRSFSSVLFSAQATSFLVFKVSLIEMIVLSKKF